jgi:hypothetical protein
VWEWRMRGRTAAERRHDAVLGTDRARTFHLPEE